MKIEILGGHGGQAKGYFTTSFLIDDKLLIDAGAVAGALTVEQQTRIENILISHCHLDHTKDLAFLCDNCFGLRPGPFQVYTHATVKHMIKAHLLNDIIWPDFTVLPTAARPTIAINAIVEEVAVDLGGYRITPVKVRHAHDAMGFIIEHGGSAVVFTLDTGPTERIWELSKRTPNLKAIFTEVSFPNSLAAVAEVSDHHTPGSLSRELEKMPATVPVILTHLKPNYREQILRELDALGEDRISVLERDGEVFHY
jgi:ribonuclease BN (tRNA processing enzyme)